VIVLGLNAHGHDAAAVLLVEGDVVFASSQERFDRKQHSSAWPREAVAAALAHAGLQASDVDAIAFPWTRDMARRRKFWHVLKGLPRSSAFFRHPSDGDLPDRRSYLRAMRALAPHLIREGFTAPLHRIPHHLAHAASAALALPEGTGAILTADGMGEWTTAATWQARRHRLLRLRRAVYPHSPGKAYAAVTQWLGFVPESGEGKTMGLAGYGRDGPRTSQATALLAYDPQTLCRIPRAMYGFPWGEARLYGTRFVEAFGPARRPSEALRDGDADVALGMQRALETWACSATRDLQAATNASALGAAGGLVLNCAMNGRVRRAHAPRGHAFHPFPVAGDAGAAWGAAAEVHRRLTGAPAAALGTLHLGHDITPTEARAAMRGAPFVEHPDLLSLAEEAARRIAEGHILAVARGRAEFGPRALGARSVLASPTTLASRDRVNALKGRESWRPVAPIVRLGDDRWFEDQTPSPYMILTFRATARARREIPGVIHTDGTARVQTVTPEQNGFIHALLEALHARGAPPVVINTSLNRRGEPIVNTAAEALAAARAMRLDGLILDASISVSGDAWRDSPGR